MKCGHPVMVWDKSTAGTMQAPCGRCIPCRLNFASMWAQRMMNEKLFWDDSIFVTLTYDDDHLPKGKFFEWQNVVVGNKLKKVGVGATLSKRDCQLFIKRLRKAIHPRKLSYYIGGEYGEEFNRPHYHAVLFGLAKGDEKTVSTAWGQGFVNVGTVTDDSCNYVAKYVTKKLSGPRFGEYEKRGVIPEFGLMSRNPAIGRRYAEKYKCELVNRGFAIVKGSKVSLPRYYTTKIYDTDERVALRESRRIERDSLANRDRRERIKEVGFAGADKDEMLRRQKVVDEVEGKIRLKRRKL